ncbi:MAG: 2-octaprenyl-6-methoxyphenyl hydroxylase [Chromatiales bacterium]|nr:2-octaprenyl-6-methoxyphenyl hydroxylase [Chromatiales bacterium]
MSATTPDVEVAIAGGGPVGSTLALALASAGVSVALIDATAPSTAARPSYDARALALSAASTRILDTLGVWPALQRSAAPIESVHVSEQGQFGSTRIHAREVGTDALGHVVSADALGQALIGAISNAGDAIQTLAPARVTDAQSHTDRITLTLDDTRERDARLAVAADGSDSFLRERFALPVERHDYGQTAIVVSVEPQPAIGATAWERFTPEGTFALLPLAGGRAKLVWAAATETTEAALELDDAAFANRAAAAFGGRFRFASIGKRMSYPLRRLIAKRDFATRLAVIGNAAHTMHPVAAQGLNLGLRDAALLAECIVAAKRDGRDFGTSSELEHYSRLRRSDQRTTDRVTDTLVRAFDLHAPGLGLLRGMALAGLDRLLPVKRRIARAGMGLAGHVPRLALGQRLDG